MHRMQQITRAFFFSRKHPQTNPFWENLQQAITDLPNDPKPDCEGFYFANWNMETKELTTEAIGIIPENKLLKYLYFATKKVMQTVLFGRTRSAEFKNENLDQYIGGVCICGHAAGVSGHDSLIDEAIAILWLYFHKSDLWQITDPDPWKQMLLNAQTFQNEQAKDNVWITIIGERMLNF